MKLPGARTLRSAVQWLGSRWTRGALILGYHHIGSPETDPYQTFVSVAHLAEQLEEVRRCACPMPLIEILACLRRGDLPPRAVALTFDDGYADTLFAAKPCLESLGIPATVFVTTGSWEREHWWDELVRLVPRVLRARSGIASSPETVSYRPSIGRDSNEPFGEGAGHLSIDRVVTAHFQGLLHLATTERQSAMEALRNQACFDQNTSSPWRALSTAEVVQLAEGGLIDIGAHTVTHPFLPDLALSEQLEEIVQSKVDLETLLRRPITGFSYPNGASTPATRNMVENAGFTYACASHLGTVVSGTPSFSLPRFWIPDWGGGTFRRWLDRWLTT
jgi:peptidoglycan/xylan/chitin deacetylase (PgdA/CDA1 family)